MNDPSTRPVVLAGAGHANLTALLRLRSRTRFLHPIILINPGHGRYSGMAAGVLGGMYPPGADCIPLDRLATRLRVRWVNASVIDLDPANRLVFLDDGQTIPFELLSLNLGRQTSGTNVPGLARFALTAKPPTGIDSLASWIDQQPVGSSGRLIVLGGGPTGVELAANAMDRARKRGLSLHVSLFTSQDRLLENSPRAASLAAKTALARVGVLVRLGHRAIESTGSEVRFENGLVQPFDRLVDATGLSPSPVLPLLGLPLADDGGLLVDATLRSTGAASVFASGDCATIAGSTIARVGVHAVRQGTVLAHNIQAAIEGRQPMAYHPQPRFLQIVNLGQGIGLAVRGNWHTIGRLPLRLKDWIDQTYMARLRPPVEAHDRIAQPSAPDPGQNPYPSDPGR